MSITVGFKTIFQSLQGYNLVLKPDGAHFIVLEISNDLLDLIQQKREVFVGKSVEEVYYEETPINAGKAASPSLDTYLQRALQQKKPIQVDNIYLNWKALHNSDCASLWSVNHKPVMDEKGEVIYIIQSFSCSKVPEKNLQLFQKQEQAKVLEEEKVYDLKQLMNVVPQMFWIANHNGEELFFLKNNLSEFAELGRPAEGLCRWQDFLHPEDLNATEQAWAEARRDRSVYEFEHRIRMKDASYRWHLSRALPHGSSSGNDLKWYGTVTDVHDKKESEEALRRSEEQLRFAVEAAELGIFYYYPPTDELFWSKKTREMIGFSPDAEASMEKFWKVIHPEDRERSNFLLQEVYSKKNGGEYDDEFRIIRLNDGKIRWVRSRGKVYYDDNGIAIRFLGVTQDITEIKEAEASLRLKNTQLTRINNDLDNFVYTASHDLKAPLNQVEGLLQLLLLEIPANVRAMEEIQNTSRLMQQALERFKKTITSLAELVKIRNDGVEEHFAIELGGVVEEVLADLEPMIRESGTLVEVDLEGSPRILFSVNNLRSVVYNMLSNGIKYRSTRRAPEVKISYKRQDKYLVLLFQDNGLGLSQENIGQLFTIFKRFHPQVEGTGIGLFLVRRMVENAGGFMEVESKEGKGTIFRVYLLTD